MSSTDGDTNPVDGDAYLADDPGDALGDDLSDRPTDTVADAALEAELGALRPRELAPALSWRIACGLAADRRSRRARRVALGLAACLAIVGVFAAAFAARYGRGERRGGDEAVVRRPQTPTPRPGGAAPGPPPATLAVYRVALTRSPEALDALLDAEARRPWPGGPVGTERVRVLN